MLFPTSISYGSGGGPKFKTTVFTADGAHEQRDPDWLTIRADYDVAENIKASADMLVLNAFFLCRRGRAYGFRYKDWADFELSGEQIANGDWASISFQMTKTYTSAQEESGESFTYKRPILKPAWNTLDGLTLDGDTLVETGPPYPPTDPLGDAYSPDQQFFTIDYKTGLITFRFVPYGPIYAGSCSSLNCTILSGPLTGLAEGADAPVFHPLGLYAYVGGDSLSAGDGVRKFRLSDGVEVANVVVSDFDPGIGAINGMSALVCIAQDGSPIVQLGNSNGQPMVKLDTTTLTPTAIFGQSHSPFASTDNTDSVGEQYFPGCVSNDGVTFVHVDSYTNNALCSIHKVGVGPDVFGTHVKSFPVTNQFLGSFWAVCPYNFSDFLLLTGDTSAGPGSTLSVFRQDKQLLSIDVNDSSTVIRAFFMAYDQSDQTVVLGWQINGQDYVSKLNFATSQELYRAPAFGLYWGMGFGSTVVNGSMCWLFQHHTIPEAATDTGVWLATMDLSDGAITARSVPVTPTGSALGVTSNLKANFNTYCPAQAILINGGANSSPPVIIGADHTGLDITPGQPIVVGACEFHVPVRFNTDKLEVVQEDWAMASIKSLPMVEVKNWADVVNPPAALVTFTWSGL